MVTIVESIQLVFTDGSRCRVKNTIALPVVVKDLEAFRKKVYCAFKPGKSLKHVNLTYTQTKYGFSYDFNR